eukprot:jgi/Mesen1/8306/ME000455S07468
MGSRAWVRVGTCGMEASGGVWVAEGGVDTWPWSVQLPLIGELTPDTRLVLAAPDSPDEGEARGAATLVQQEEELRAAEEEAQSQRQLVSRLRKALKGTPGHRQYRQLAVENQRLQELIARTEKKA